MKKRVLSRKSVLMLSCFLVLMLLLVTGCGGQDTPEPEPAPEPTPEPTPEPAPEPKLSGTISMAGSTSVQPLSEALAEVFMKDHPDVRLEVAGGGSSAGPKSVVSGAAEIGAASRELKEEELAETEGIVIAIDGIAVIVHKDNPINDLSFEDVQKIFRGEIVKWNEVGGESNDIVVVNREEGSGTRGAFHDIVVGSDNEFVATAIIQNSTGAVREAVSNDVYAIGYVSLGGVNDSIQPVKIDGVTPTVAEVVSKKYPIARPFNYVIKKGATLSDAAQAFIDFVLSPEGQKVVADNGFVPVK